MSGPFDRDLQAVDCAGCAQRVAKVDGRCPICAAVAARGRGQQRPLVAPPWPRLVLTSGAPLSTPRGPRAELALAACVVLGGPEAGLGDAGPVLRIEPQGDLAAALVCTALASGVRVDGAELAPGERRTVAPGVALAFAGREGRVL